MNIFNATYGAMHKALDKLQVRPEIILVDDGSSRTRAEEVLEGWELPEWGATLQLWRCTRDLGFNSHGCRNLIAKYAQTDVIAFFDIDQIMYPGDVARLKKFNFYPDQIMHHYLYFKDKQVVIDRLGHMNCFMIHKDLFWKAGGYDESFTGHHWGDREFLDRIWKAEARKRHSGCIVELNRGGREGYINHNITKSQYVDDDLYFAPLSQKEIKKLRGSVKKRLNFPFIRIL